ncbi:MAG: phytoene desaturase family protein [Gemmatimonadaceae bacterium]|nr:phytoene desaturase family protein [Gemmatimonadaceae bacterium]
MRIVVIGSGFGGLAAAIRLQAQGHDVTIVEKLDKAGGRAYVFERDGFTFDAGPTIVTAPWLLDAIFASAGARTADYVTLVQCDPFYNVRFQDGSVFRYNADLDALRAQVARFEPRDVEGFERFRRDAKAICEAGMALIDVPLDTIGSMLKVAPALARLRADRSVAQLAAHHLRDPRLQQVFSFHPLLVGGNPFAASAMYALIHYLEQQWGVWFAMGGTGALVRGLVRCFEELGGTIRYGAEVAEITLTPDLTRATGVRLVDGTHLAGDHVVCNGDVSQAHRALLPAAARRHMTDARIDRFRHSMSLFVIYFGTNRRYEELAHHEILLGPRYKGLLSDIFDRKVLSDDFSLYLHRPTATDPSLAPPGHDAFYVLSPVPNLAGDVDWEAVGPRASHRPALLPRHAQQPPRRGVRPRTDALPERLLPAAREEPRRAGALVLRRRSASGCRAAGRDGEREDRRRLHRRGEWRAPARPGRARRGRAAAADLAGGARHTLSHDAAPRRCCTISSACSSGGTSSPARWGWCCSGWRWRRARAGAPTRDGGSSSSTRCWSPAASRSA